MVRSTGAMTRSGSRPLSRIPLVLAGALILAATIPPSSEGGVGNRALCLLCGERGLADFILNLALYVPFGLALAARAWTLIGVMATAGALSLGIEAAQLLVIPGRDASLGDLLSNTAGAGIGWLAWLERVWGPKADGRVAASLPIVAALAAVAAVLVGLWLLEGRYPEKQYHLQWTRELPHMEAYPGEVLTTGVGSLELNGPPGPIRRSASVRTLLLKGGPAWAVVRTARPRAGLAQIFGLSVYADGAREIVFLGADGTDLVYRHRRVAETIKLDRADTRFPGAFAGVEPGTVVEISVQKKGTDYCAGVGDRFMCVPALSAPDTWTLLAYRPSLRPWIRDVAGYLWLALLFAPAGLVGVGWRKRGMAAGIAALGLSLGPLLLGAPVTSIFAIFSAILGIMAAGTAVDAVRLASGGTRSCHPQ